jgi:hypothetical protein
MSTLEEWTAAVRDGLGLDPGPLSAAETRAVLDLARDAAHAVDRLAAPLTAYLLGLAVGRGLALPEASERVRELAAGWTESRSLPDSYLALTAPTVTGRGPSEWMADAPLRRAKDGR